MQNSLVRHVIGVKFMHFELRMTEFVLNMMNFAFKVMNLVLNVNEM